MAGERKSFNTTHMMVKSLSGKIVDIASAKELFDSLFPCEVTQYGKGLFSQTFSLEFLA